MLFAANESRRLPALARVISVSAAINSLFIRERTSIDIVCQKRLHTSGQRESIILLPSGLGWLGGIN